MRFPLLAFLVIPIAELYLLFALADVIGGLATLMIVIVTAFTGVSVLRQQGLNTLNRANQRLREGQLPGQEIVEGMLLTFAGALLITPGLITDTIGFALLTPAIRRRLATKILARGMAGGGVFMGGFYRTSAHKQSGGDIIDGEVVDRDSPRSGESLFPGSERDREQR
jgi:UPF0716 protein FxsA